MSATVRPPEAVRYTTELEVPGGAGGFGVAEAGGVGGAGLEGLGLPVGGAVGGSLPAEGLVAGRGGRDGEGLGLAVSLGVAEPLLARGELAATPDELVQEVSSAVASRAVSPYRLCWAKRVRMATAPDVVPAARAGRLPGGTSGAYAPVPRVRANDRCVRTSRIRTGTSAPPWPRPAATRPGG
uniref:Uncharacterized protein n=1 Tax=Kitasatospora sp. CMC57 TaxID=3231513 RepID=A0AB33K856_9ACTN